MIQNPYRLHDRLLKIKPITYSKQANYLAIVKPTKPGRARSLGYKATKDFSVIRAHIAKGGIKAITPSRGRKHPNFCRTSRSISHQRILEKRVLRRYPNLRCIGSYKLTETGKRAWYQYICIPC